MTVPSFQNWFQPLLRRLQDGRDHRMVELYEVLADDLQISEADRAELLPSGVVPTYKSRISWARTYLKMAGLVEQPQRSVVRITPAGLDALKNKGVSIDVAYLRTIPAFAEWHSAGRRSQQ